MNGNKEIILTTGYGTFTTTLNNIRKNIDSICNESCFPERLGYNETHKLLANGSNSTLQGDLLGRQIAYCNKCEDYVEYKIIDRKMLGYINGEVVYNDN